MHSVLFNFHMDASLGLQESVLSEIRGWDAAVSVGRVVPNAKDPEELRSCFVYVKKEDDVQPVMERLKALSEIEAVFVPAKRGLF